MFISDVVIRFRITLLSYSDAGKIFPRTSCDKRQSMAEIRPTAHAGGSLATNRRACVYTISNGPRGPAVFDFRMGREREGPKRFLGNFAGILQSDGYGAWITPPWYINTLITRKRVVNAKQIKDEIRKLSRIDKTAIYKWIDEQSAADLLSRIGVYRSRENGQGVEQKRRVIS
jgi:hypothetical protein